MLLSFAALFVGVAVSTARPAGIVTALLLLPGLTFRQPTRRSCYAAAAGYYTGALWPLAVGAKNFFGPGVSAVGAVAFWMVSALLLALPYALLWTARTRQLLWRAPAARSHRLRLTVDRRRFLFPAWSWAGVTLALAGCGLVAAHRRLGIPTLAVVGLVANALYSDDPAPPPDWQAVSTHFGAISHGPVRHPPRSGWLDELGRLKGGRVVGLTQVRHGIVGFRDF
jgi:hypothetical protein